MDVKGWNDFYAVFQEVNDCFISCLEETGETGIAESYYEHYLFYVFLFMAVKSELIPYRGNVPVLALLKRKLKDPIFCEGYDKEFLNLVIGIMAGCGFDLPVMEYVRYPAYLDGKSTYFKTVNQLREDLLAAINKLPLEVSLCWQEEARMSAENCTQAAYYMDSGFVMIAYTHRRYYRLICAMDKEGAAAEDKKSIKTAFQNCQDLFYFGDVYPNVEVDDITYCCEVTSPIINTVCYGDLDCGFSPFLNKMFIFYAVKLSLLIEEMELKYIEIKKDGKTYEPDKPLLHM